MRVRSSHSVLGLAQASEGEFRPTGDRERSVRKLDPDVSPSQASFPMSPSLDFFLNYTADPGLGLSEQTGYTVVFLLGDLQHSPP